MTARREPKGDGLLTCPNCGGKLEWDTVDNGVGEEQIGPKRCDACHWVEERIPLEFTDDI